MIYNEAFEILANYASEALPYFADRWSRWPDERAAGHILRILEKKRDLYASYPDVVAKIVSVAAELMIRASMVESEYTEWVKQKC